MKICIITAHFPNYDCSEKRIYATEFVTQYAVEWVSQGHEVYIIHLMRKYPAVFYSVAKILGKIGFNRYEKFLVPKEALTEANYIYKSIRIKRLLFRKNIPHSCVSKFEAKRLVKKTINYISSDTDIFIGDCFDPILQLLPTIHKKYPMAKLYQIVHNSDFSYKSKNLVAGAEIIDTWLLRSKAQEAPLREYLRPLEVNNQLFMYSGIEPHLLAKNPRYRKEIHNLLYVGALYKTKGLGTILDAISKTKNSNLRLQVIGSGEDETFFKQKVKDLDLCGKVVFLGKKQHSEVFQYMDKADALVLISHETFGMVYVEAMSQACIPIGVKDDGIDGVVINGENGYLVPLADATALAELFDSWMNVKSEKVMYLSKNAYKTAKSLMTDALAESIINNA